MLSIPISLSQNHIRSLTTHVSFFVHRLRRQRRHWASTKCVQWSARELTLLDCVLSSNPFALLVSLKLKLRPRYSSVGTTGPHFMHIDTQMRFFTLAGATDAAALNVDHMVLASVEDDSQTTVREFLVLPHFLPQPLRQPTQCRHQRRKYYRVNRYF